MLSRGGKEVCVETFWQIVVRSFTRFHSARGTASRSRGSKPGVDSLIAMFSSLRIDRSLFTKREALAHWRTSKRESAIEWGPFVSPLVFQFA